MILCSGVKSGVISLRNVSIGKRKMLRSMTRLIFLSTGRRYRFVLSLDLKPEESREEDRLGSDDETLFLRVQVVTL